jgi:hypothetical protein
MKRSLIVLLVGLMAFSAYASVYPDMAGNWADANIWSKGVVPPDDGDEIKISTVDGITVTVNTNVGNYSTTKIDTLRDCTLEVLAGGYIGGGREWHIGDAGASGSGTDIGYLTQTGGTVDITASGKMFVGYKEGGDGRYTISGGSLDASGENGRLYIGCGSTAGSIGLFNVVGSAASISVDGLYVASASSSGDDDVGTATIRFDVDGTGAVSEIVTDGVAINAGGGGHAVLVVNATVLPAADVVLIRNTGTSDVAGKFDSGLMNGVGTSQMVLGGNYYQLVYHYDADSDGQNNDVALLLIPEPATMLLLGLGGLLIRRRK